MTRDERGAHPADETPTPHRRLAAVWRRYLRLWGPSSEADLNDELEFHVAMRVRELVARGVTETTAREAALRRLGDLDRVRSECAAIDARMDRRMNRIQWLDALRQDIRFAARGLLRQKGWTAVGVLTLAIGIGANTAVFSVINRLLLHPLPYPHADRLAMVYQQLTTGGRGGTTVRGLANAPTFRAWRAASRAFEDLEGYTTAEMVLQPSAGRAVLVHGAGVMPGFASFAGTRPLLGRNFTDRDVRSGAKVALLSEGTWRARYGADLHIAGRTLKLDGTVYTIVGVMPSAFRLPPLLQGHTDVFTPLAIDDDQLVLSVVGRLRPGASDAAATAELAAIAGRAQTQLGFTPIAVPPGHLIGYRGSLLMLAGAVALVLLIACANIAHLLLARGATRQREMAIRTVLGAGGGRLVRQLLTESLVLAGVGCAAGVLVGWIGLRALVALRPESLSQLGAAHVDVTTLLVAAALATVTGIAFGLAGVMQSTRLQPSDVLKTSALNASEERSHVRLRSLLVVTEMALCTMLLVDAALLVRGVMRLQRIDPGFRPGGLYTITANFSATSRRTPESQWAFSSRVAERARGLPGVAAITVSTAAPPVRAFTVGPLEVEGQPPPAPNAASLIDLVGARRDFFRVMGMRLLQGTTFTDTTQAGGQVVINAGLAHRFWPGGSAVGHRLRVGAGGPGTWLTIVGVVNDAATGGLVEDASQPTFYLPTLHSFPPVMLARLDRPAVAIPALRAMVGRMDPAIPALHVTSVADAMAGSIAGQRFTMLLLTVFAGLALVLAAIGLYGVMAYAVAQRTREIGIRVAIGATPANIARNVLARGLVLGAVGVGIGLMGAHWGTRLVSEVMTGVRTSDPASLSIAAAVLLVTAVVACAVPMRRAMRVSPVVAMRAD